MSDLTTCNGLEDAQDYLETVLLDMPTSVLIDSRTAESAGSALEAQISFGSLLGLLRNSCPLFSAGYYYAYPIAEDERGAKTLSFLGYMRREGWKTWWSEPNRTTPEVPHISPKVKLAVDAMKAVLGGAKQILLAVKGPDFDPLVEALEGLGVRVVLVTWTDQRTEADAVLDLRKILPAIVRRG